MAAAGYSIVAESAQDVEASVAKEPWTRRARLAIGAGAVFAGALLLAAAAAWAGEALPHSAEGYALTPTQAAYEAAGAQCAVAQRGITYKNAFTFGAPGVMSQQECCARCQAVPPCRAWVWRPELTQCWLKGGQLKMTAPLQGAVAGTIPGRAPVPGMTEFRFSFQAVHHNPKFQRIAFGCQAKPLPQLWPPQRAASPVQFKVMSFNLEWWHLFDHAHPPEFNFYRTTPGNAGTQLVASAAAQGAYDIMAFQECADGAWLAERASLGAYTMLDGDDGRCMAFKKQAWTLVASGQGNVAEDTLGLYYGQRGVQWARLRSVQTGAIVFFMNHHGPLPMNSGGMCGGAATAYNLLQTIAVNGRPGDSVVLAGDFNANAGGLTIKALGTKLTRVMQGTADGGVDFVFTNNVPVINKANLGHGGSDHEALEVTFNVGA